MTYSEMYRRPRSVRRSQSVGVYELSRQGLGPLTNILFIAAVVAVIGLIYLTQITKTSVFGFQVNALKEQKQSLQEANQDLKIEAARLQSIERLRSSQVAGQLSETDELSFANGRDSSVQ